MTPESSLIFAMLVAQAVAQETAIPKFEDFAVATVFKGTPAPPVLRTAGQRMFRTMIREGAKKGPNFAGHYTMASWGCGSACVSVAIIDAETGVVYDGPFRILGWEPYRYEDKISSLDDFEELVYRLDSRLLIVRGCPEDKNCASYFYEWTGASFKLIRKIDAVRISN